MFDDGGGIDVQGGTLILTDSTLSDNVGGAITAGGGTVNVADSTLSSNSFGAGIENSNGTCRRQHSLQQQ
jgi:hypothetical protein